MANGDPVHFVAVEERKWGLIGYFTELRWRVMITKGEDTGGVVWESAWFSADEYQMLGQNYRMNRVLAQALAKYLNENPTQWQHISSQAPA